MMFIKKFLYTALLLCLCATSVQALPVYTCDFEDPTEKAAWKLNYMLRQVSLENKWYIGQAGQFGTRGSNGLFVATPADSTHALYAATQTMYTIAFRDMTLQPGTYNILFDTRLGGGTTAKLDVWWMPASVTIISSNSLPPDWTNKGGVHIATSLYNMSNWKSYTASFTVSQANTAGRLVFVWSSAAGTPTPPSACVDNIEIYDGDLCASQPTGISYTKGTLSWKGNASEYEVMLYNCSTDEFEPLITVQGNSVVLNQISTEGYFIFNVRAVCADGTHSPWGQGKAFLYIPGSRCIDYMDFGADKTHTGMCYIGDFDTFIRNNQQGTLGVQDDGTSAATSMHTLHTDPNEYDANTRDIDGGFKTVPAGEIASVRLGAYTGSGQSARIEYKYKVLPGMSDLLDLKYAVVMQSGGHGEDITTSSDMQPTFRLDVLDGNGVQLSSTCTHLDFKPGFGDTRNWHNNEATVSYGAVYWFDWSTVTVSLRPYVGQTLTIRLTSTRCSYDTHYAYAYFTIGCRGGELEGISCGDFSTDHFTAPDGFNYEWYQIDNPNTVISHDQTLNISTSDANIYAVNLISKTDAGCYYTLVANPNPRFPIAAAAVDTAYISQCTHLVEFVDSSHVAIINRNDYTQTISGEPLDYVEWIFGDGDTIRSADAHITHAYPATGGAFAPMVIASMSNGVCVDTLYLDTIYLPNLLSGPNDTIIHRCEGDGYKLPSGKVIYNDSIYRYTEPNQYGCEVDKSIDIRFHAPTSDVQDVELCEGGYFDFEGVRYTETGTYDVHLNTVYGCDSLLRLNLTILPQLKVSVPDTVVVCADSRRVNIPYEHIQGRMSAITIYADNKAISQGLDSIYTFGVGEDILISLPDSLRPDNYSFVIDFGAPDCPAAPVKVVLSVYYASTVMEQKHDLLALLNAGYNGGFTWTAYQWYCNGYPMPYAVTSYLVLTDDQIGNEYYCVLTRDDGVVMPTCPVIYQGHKTAIDHTYAALEAYPTIVSPQQTIYLPAADNIVIYDILGNTVAQYSASYGGLAIPAPMNVGTYILLDSTHHAITKIIVR